MSGGVGSFCSKTLEALKNKDLGRVNIIKNPFNLGLQVL